MRPILHHLVDAALFGFAGEQAAPHVERDFQVGLHFRQHGDAAGNVKAADHHRNTGLAKRPRQIERARELVRLRANQPHHAEAVMPLELGDDVFDADPVVGFVDGGDVDRHVGPQHLPLRGVISEGVDACQGI